MRSSRTGLILSILALVGALSGCGKPRAGATGAAAAAGPEAEVRGLTFRLKLAFQEARRSQAVVERNTMANVDHVVVRVLALRWGQAAGNASWEPVNDPGGNPLKVDTPSGTFDRELVFTGLAGKALYRFMGYAYKAPGESPSDLISTEDSFIDFGAGLMGQVGNPSAPRLTIFLAPKAFFGGTNQQPVEIEAGPLITFGPPEIYVPDSARTDPPGTVFVPQLTEEIANQEWQWGDEEYGDDE